MSSSSSKWTDDQKSKFKMQLMTKPIINCKRENYINIIDCIMKKFVDVYDFNNIMRQISQPLTPVMQNIIGSCMTSDCLVDVLLQEHTNIPPQVAKCMVGLAMKEANNLPIVAVKYLHDDTKLAEYVLKCVNQQ
jgi:hypothetical protein